MGGSIAWNSKGMGDSLDWNPKDMEEGVHFQVWTSRGGIQVCTCMYEGLIPGKKVAREIIPSNWEMIHM